MAKELPEGTKLIVAFYSGGPQPNPSGGMTGKRIGVYTSTLTQNEFEEKLKAWLPISEYKEMTIEEVNQQTVGTENYFEVYEDVTDPPF